jgi:hypothetical protein
LKGSVEAHVEPERPDVKIERPVLIGDRDTNRGDSGNEG